MVRGGGCVLVRRRLTLFMEGELPARRAAGVRAHLGACRWCRRVWLALGRTVDDLHAYRRSPVGAGSVVPAVRRRLARRLGPDGDAAGRGDLGGKRSP